MLRACRHPFIVLVATARLAHAGVLDEPKAFDIPAGVASSRLNDFSAQSDVQVLFTYELMKSENTQAVQCLCKPREALDRMLAGTRITYELINGRTLAFSYRVPDQKPVRQHASTTARVKTDRFADSSLAEITVSAAARESTLPMTGAPEINLSRADIDASGFPTVPSLVSTLPQKFGGGPTEDTFAIGREASTNAARGTGVNLRGLGAGSTLVLLNGNRLAASGIEGQFVDISSIPLAAVERVDILSDSSSTLYGSDAPGGVVNFVMRQGMRGAQTDAYYSTATRGSLTEVSVSQMFGQSTEHTEALVAVEYYHRDRLPAADRRQARSDLRLFGGSNFDLLQANPGNIVAGPFTWAIPRGQDGSALSPADLVSGTPNTQNRLEAADILPAQRRTSLFATGRYQSGNQLAWFADLLATQRNVRMSSGGQIATLTVPATNPFYVNPLENGAPVIVTYNFLNDLGPVTADTEVRSTQLTFGLEARLPHDWQAIASGSFAGEQLTSDVRNQVDPARLYAALQSSDPLTAFNPFGDGSFSSSPVLEELRSASTLSTRSTLTSWRLWLYGPALHLPGGDVSLRVGAEERQQALRSSSLRERQSQAGFVELIVPVTRALELSAGNRYERYDDFGDALTQRLGITWTPVTDLTLSGTWSESFRPPGLMDVDERTNAYGFLTLRDPQTPNGISNVLIWQGKNRDLHEETARSWTAGLVFTPRALESASFALTYFNTDFSNRIEQPSLSTDLLTNTDLAALITRDPSQAFRQDVCRRALQPSTLGNCLTTPISAIADLRLRNDARMRTRGVDAMSRYSIRSSLGLFSAQLRGSYLFEFSESRSSTAPLLDRVSTPNYPVDLRLSAGVRWQRSSWDVSSWITYFDSYRDDISIPSRPVASWTTVDLGVTYTPRLSGEIPIDTLLGGTSISLSIRNLLDTDPPFLNNAVGIGYDQENGDLTGRVIGLRLRKLW